MSRLSDGFSQVPVGESLASRLYKRFGPGSRPDLRQQLYTRLELLCTEGPPHQTDRAYQIVVRTASDAQGKTEPSKYFCRVVLLRLQEAGIIGASDFVL
ncbi:MAG: hypothetical protein V4529_17265 [Gemmatimonadota bacterium]